MGNTSSNGETWRPVVGYEGSYEVSSLGRVRSVERLVPCKNRWGQIGERRYKGRVVKPYPNRGYLYVWLSVDGVQSIHPVHRIVAVAFHGTRPEGFEPNHENGDKADNRAANLSWTTRRENVRHAHDVLGSHNRGERNGRAKLTDEQAQEIRRCLESGETGKAVAKRFGISPNTVSRIRNGAGWSKVVGEPLGAAHTLSEHRVKSIRRQLAKGVPTDAIAAKFGVSRTHVYRIRNGNTWRHVD